MSGRIRHFLAGGAHVVIGEVGTPLSQSSASVFVVTVMLVFGALILLQGNAVGKQKVVSRGEDAVTSFLVKETGSSDFLKAKNIDKRISPASLTKIMTCMVAIESGRLDDVVTIPLVATQVEPTRAGFKPGDRVRLRDLVKAAMVHSSNDAAFAIAVHLGGSLKGFVSKMNTRARALGMTHTRFTNPAGYDHGSYAGNRSTARDLMKLTEHAIRYSEFNKIAKLDRAVFNELNTGKRYSLRSHNKLLDRYPYSVGIKTGYTSKAGPCLIARAVFEGRDMLVIMLHAKTDRWELASLMFDQGFSLESAPRRSLRVKKTQIEEIRAVAIKKSQAAKRSSTKSSKTAAVSFKKRSVKESATVPAEVVYARRAEALEALRLKVERQKAERETTNGEPAKHSEDQAGNQQTHRTSGGKNFRSPDSLLSCQTDDLTGSRRFLPRCLSPTMMI